MDEVKELKVDRCTWSRGTSGNGWLYDNSNKKCCILGFYLNIVHGVTKDKMDLKEAPIEGMVKQTAIPFLIDDEDEPTILFDSIVFTNDSKKIREKRRENKLIKLMKELGIKLSFFGGKKC